MPLFKYRKTISLVLTWRALVLFGMREKIVGNPDDRWQSARAHVCKRHIPSPSKTFRIVTDRVLRVEYFSLQRYTDRATDIKGLVKDADDGNRFK